MRPIRQIPLVPIWMVPILTIVLCWAGSLPAMAASAPGERELMLVTGEQQVLDATDITSFSESTSGIIEVKVPRDGHSMVITAIRPGRTSLLLITKQRTQHKVGITVFAHDPDTVIRELGRLLEKQTGIQFLRIGPKVFIDGMVNSESDLQRVERVCTLYPDQVESLVQAGKVVAPRTNVRLDLTFLEMNASQTIGGGIKWPGAVGAGGSLEMSYNLMTGTTAASYRVVNQAVPVIHAAEQSGVARIKKRASLMTTDGNEAHYQSGGEVNIPIAGSQSAELRSIAYGCTLTVLPVLDLKKHRIDLHVTAEVSDLREMNQDAPGRTVSRVSTVVHLAFGQSIILSGLDAESDSTQKDGLPFLSRIPIVGMFFGRHQRHREKTSGLIAITPIIITDPAEHQRERLRRALKKFSNAQWWRTTKPLKQSLYPF